MSNLLVSLALLILPALVLSRHITQELVDLTYVYDDSTIGWLPETPYKMTVNMNGTTEDGSMWLQTEDILSATHWGTHIDAPCHMFPGLWKLEEIPLERLLGLAAVVDMTDRAATDRDALLQISDLEDWESTWNTTLDDTIVLVRTGWGSRWPDWEAYTGTADKDITKLRFPGVSGEAAEWLAKNRTIYGLGIEGLSLDSGIGENSGLPAHLALLGANIYGLENVANLDKLPGYGAELLVSPMRLGGGACGSPTRISAFLP